NSIDTGSKPFLCRLCNRPFARQDSLLRHERLHARQSKAPSASASPSITSQPITPESLNRLDEADNERTCPEPLGGGLQPDGPEYEMILPPDMPSELVWPDSEDLFNDIMLGDVIPQQLLSFGTLPIETQLLIDPLPPATSSDPAESIDAIPTGGNRRAVQDVSKMIANLSSSVTAAAESTSISSVFLDECLHMFFVRFIPILPILHRATFVFKDCTQQLLLNAIAIGSLYLGPKDAIVKGEALWHLAHTAIATSWQSLINHRGPHDASPGVQLVTSALLSQIYGALSRNRSIRTTSQAFQSLSFFWARHCGMIDGAVYNNEGIPSLDAPAVEKDQQWRIWAAREIQQRACLANFVLDGLISQMTGEPTSTRHATSHLVIPSCECAFEASTADEWIAHIQTQSSEKPTFRRLLHQLFENASGSPYTDHTFTALSFKVLLEAIQSLISDSDGDSSAVGVPSRTEIQRALGQLYHNIMGNSHLSSADRLETLLRWHTLCLDTIINSALLCRHLCHRLNVEQHVWKTGTAGTEKLSNIDVRQWAATNNARKALLHAAAIQDIIEQLPRGRAHAIHMPSALFSATTIYAAFSSAAIRTIKVPVSIVWQDSLLDVDQPYFTLAEMSNPALGSDTVRFIRGEALLRVGTNKNLFYELNSIQKLFRCLYSQWGIAFDMEAVVDQWIKVCR
ncbi:C2H2 type zinc finger domain protein, partial [Microthyrium microscopicum]